MDRGRLPLRATATLGIVAIVGFGAWFYGYGVLLEPIQTETGWPESSLSLTYALSLFGSGVLATIVGRQLHRHGPRRTYLAGAVVCLPSYLVLADAGSPTVFLVAGAVAGSVTGALGYYAAVHTVIAQLVPASQRARAITTNTLWGAFASPIFLPAMAWLVLGVGWRPTLRIVGVAVTASFVVGALVVPDSRGPEESHVPLRAALAASGRDRATRALLLTTFGGGFQTSILILYQVSAMTAGGTGLPLALASGLAGARGFLQLAGRLPVPWLVRRVGSGRTLKLAHALTGAGCLLLIVAQTLPTAVAFAVVAGFAIGSLVPIESIFTAALISERDLGMILGLSSLTRGIGAAIGPTIAAALAAATGSGAGPSLLAASIVAGGAALLVPARAAADQHGEVDGEVSRR